MKKIIIIAVLFLFEITSYAQLSQADFNRIYELNLGNNPKNADDAIAQFETKFPNDARVIFLRGMYQYHDGDENGAMRSYSNAIKTNPKFGYAFLQRSYIFDKKGLYDKAIDDISEYIKLNSQSKQGFELRAGLYYKTENYQAALNDFKSIIAIKPANAVVYMDVANTYAKLNQAQNGKTFLDNAFAIKGIDLDVLNIVYGQFLLNQGEFANAKQKYSAAFVKGSSKFESDDFSNFSVCAYKTNDLENGIIYIKKAIALNPKNMDYRCSLASFYKDKNEFANIIQAMQEALLINDNHPMANMYMGFALIQTGNQTEGQRYQDKAKRLDAEQNK